MSRIPKQIDKPPLVPLMRAKNMPSTPKPTALDQALKDARNQPSYVPVPPAPDDAIIREWEAITVKTPVGNEPRCATCGCVAYERFAMLGSPGLGCRKCYDRADKEWTGAALKKQADANVDTFQAWLVDHPFPAGKNIDRLALLALNLAGEAGEVVEPIKKHLRDGTELDMPHLMAELGDVLTIVTALASYFGMSMSDVMFMAKDKMEGRIERNTLIGEGDDR